MVPLNFAMTLEARIAVARLTTSQGSLERTASFTEPSIFSSLSIPPIRWISSVASSLMTSMTSSTVTIPTILPFSSTTGSAAYPYLVKSRATASWSRSVRTEITLSFMMSEIRVSKGAMTRSRRETTPISL